MHAHCKNKVVCLNPHKATSQRRGFCEGLVSLWLLTWIMRSSLAFTHSCQEGALQLRDAGLTTKPRNCQVGMSQCYYLDHTYMVGSGAVCPEPSKVDAIKSFSIPQTKQQVSSSFRGLTGYYGKIHSRLLGDSSSSL